jgi:pimeloyl-ACP methyl ester carboxylesterase
MGATEMGGTAMQTVAAFTERTVILPGVALSVTMWGQPNPARTIILVHGLTASSRTWVELGPALAAQGWHVLAPDLRGRGQSGKPAHGYGIAIHANDLLALCDMLGLDQVAIIGHSLGAVIAMYAAAFYPARVSRIAMIDAGGEIPPDTAQAIAASVNRLGMVFPSLDAYLAAMSQLPVIQWNPFWEQYFRYDALVRPDGTVTSRVPKAAIDEESLALAMTRSEALPPLVRQPVLVARAALGTLAADRGFVLPRAEMERLQQVMPDCRAVEIPATNHYTIILAPELRDALIGFLNEQAGG